MLTCEEILGGAFNSIGVGFLSRELQRVTGIMIYEEFLGGEKHYKDQYAMFK